MAVSLRWLVALLLAGPLLGGTHPDSESSSVITVEENAVTWRHTVQVASLTEALPNVDADFDGELSEAELWDSHTEIARYFDEHWQLDLNGLPPPGFATKLVPSSEPGLFGAIRRLNNTRPVHRLTVRVDPFMENDPWHRAFVEVHFEEDEPQALAFGAGVTEREVQRLELPFSAGIRVTMSATALGLVGVVWLLVSAYSTWMAALWFLGGALLGAAAGYAELAAPEPFGSLLVGGTVVLIGVDALLAKGKPRWGVAALALGALAIGSVSSTFDPQVIVGGAASYALLKYLSGWGVGFLVLCVYPLGWLDFVGKRKLVSVATIVAGVVALWMELR